MTTKEIDAIYDAADMLMKEGHFFLIDDLLEYYGLGAWRLDIDLLMSWATVTLPAKNKLKRRGFFMEKCLKFHSDPKEPDLWKGLEQ